MERHVSDEPEHTGGMGGSSPELMAAGRRGATRHREAGCVRADAQLSAARDGVVRLSDVMSAVVRCHVSGFRF